MSKASLFHLSYNTISRVPIHILILQHFRSRSEFVISSMAPGDVTPGSGASPGAGAKGKEKAGSREALNQMPQQLWNKLDLLNLILMQMESDKSSRRCSGGEFGRRVQRVRGSSGVPSSLRWVNRLVFFRSIYCLDIFSDAYFCDWYFQARSAATLVEPSSEEASPSRSGEGQHSL